MFQTLDRGPNLALSVNIICLRDRIECALELAHSILLLTVIDSCAPITSDKLISPSTKMSKKKMENRRFQDRPAKILGFPQLRA